MNNNVANVVRHVRLRPTSLRGRLVLGAVGVGLVFALLFGTAAAWRIHHAADQAIGAALQSRLELARSEVAPDGSLRTDPASPKSDLVQIVGADGLVLTSSPGLRGMGPLSTPTALGSSPLGVRGTASFSAPDVDLATLAVPWRVTGVGRVVEPVTLVVALDTEGFTTANDNLTGILVVGLGVVILLVLLPSTSRPRRVPGHDLIDILDPIVDNAIRHTPPSGDIRIEVCPSPPDQLVVDVSNTGSPVPADLAPHIFDAWVSTRAGSEAGGLGLWVARETARDLGGDVLLVTGFPGSTRFRVSLPVPG